MVRISSIADPYFDRYSQLAKQHAGGSDRAGRRKRHGRAAQINQQYKLSSPVLQAACGFKSIFLASDLMKYDPIRITADSDLTKAAEIMTQNRISRLPVIDNESTNNPVGIITKPNIVRAISILS